MFSTLRTRFGIPGVISVIALVFAMFGGAYAASNSSGGGKATASAKAKKGPRGPKGATGPAGPQGPAGPAGAKGDAGANGSNGTNGTSATTAAYSGAECENGGVEVKSASPTTYVCNGEDGETGFTETLPTGKSEKGTWGYGFLAEGAGGLATISFGIPLAAPVEAHFLGKFGGGTAECPGTSEEPAAAAGNLCIWEGEYSSGVTLLFILNPETTAPAQAGKSGALLRFSSGTNGYGVWAVTAP